jgi:parallel beta-helix repeat protein/predicted outer membrane repeat protein
MDKILRSSLVFVILFAGCILTDGVDAATLEVGPSGYPYASIQAAINVSAAGDTVFVHDGTYVENINFSGKAITVKSENGAAGTIINGNGASHVVTFDKGEGSGSVLDGFTITNGNGPYESWGGGIRCASSSPTITRCIITGNSSYAGGGICCQSSSSPTITDCTIRGNTAFLGGGIFCKSGSSPVITNCTISGNTGSAHSGAIGCDSGCSPIITNCIINGNTAGDGGGIYSYRSSPTIINCTISGNTATSRGGAIRCQQGTASVKNSILWGNVPSEVYLDAGDTITFTSSNIDQDGYAGSGNIRQDPLFVDSGYGDFSLMSNSPCIDAGTSEGAPPTDINGHRRFDAVWISNTGPGAFRYYDMGALEYTDTGWVLADVPSLGSEWYLNGIHFTSPTEGWAVGGDATQGVLLHYSGGTWTSVTPPDVGAGSEWDLDVVHFTSASNGWAVGGGNDRVVFLHYSRGKWTSIDPPADSNNWWVYAMQFTSAKERPFASLFKGHVDFGHASPCQFQLVPSAAPFHLTDRRLGCWNGW